MKNINYAIEKTGISKKEIAEKLGITYATLWKVLHGQLRLKPEYIAEIAYMTCRTPNDFFMSIMQN
ncbi:MAG: helix-turn-helix transcriptional regulator [Synergistaceae bacterium]|nr:helix-turn-helix transcriptional regulator [Synergistaceae bacterium]MBR0252525.1 helix-turn-helix transcriptional regulator [Synergistaceae bacterium]